MIKINLHGKLGQDIGESWELEVSSVAEAFRAIESNTRKFRKWILKYANEYEYEILVDKSNLFSEKPDFKSIEEIKNSELFINLDNKIEVIDVVPCIIGSGGIGKIVTGVVSLAAAVVVGVFFPPLIPLAVGVGIAGLGLIAAGTSELLSKPPPNIPFTAQQVNPIGGEGESGGPTSYLFNGPVNTVGEGGPVPVGYGRLLVGGNNVYANYDIIYRAYNATTSKTTSQTLNEIQGDQYVFNSRCYLIDQNSSVTLPF
jgi:predicted phage tail protein